MSTCAGASCHVVYQLVGPPTAALYLLSPTPLFRSLNLISITVTGAQAADFAFAAGNTCPTGAGSVAPGASCTISDRKSTRLNSSHRCTAYVVFCSKRRPQSASLAGNCSASGVDC